MTAKTGPVKRSRVIRQSGVKAQSSGRSLLPFTKTENETGSLTKKREKGKKAEKQTERAKYFELVIMFWQSSTFIRI